MIRKICGVDEMFLLTDGRLGGVSDHLHVKVGRVK